MDLLIFLLPMLIAVMLVRNEWVYRVSAKMIWEDYEKYKRLPSYWCMLWRFWIWDVEKFVK